MKTRKIAASVSVDGAKKTFRDLHSLKRYVESLYLQEHLRALAVAPIDWSARSKLLEERKARKLKRRQINRDLARRPRRKDITKDKLTDYEAKFKAKHQDKTRGLQKAMQLDFKADKETLKKRMRD